MTSQSGLGRRAAVGAMLVAGRSLIAQAIALVAVAVLTRHLSAREFGLLAAGTAITARATVLEARLSRSRSEIPGVGLSS